MVYLFVRENFLFIIVVRPFYIKNVIVEQGGPSSINPFRFILTPQGKITHKMISFQKKNTVVYHLKFLFDINISHPVYIRTFIGVHFDLFNRKCGIIHPKISFKGEFILSSWIEDNIITPFAVNKSTIGKHIIVGLRT